MPARPTKPASYPVSVRQVAVLLHASFRHHLAGMPLRFANPSPPSGWIEDFHFPATEHAGHTTRSRETRAISDRSLGRFPSSSIFNRSLSRQSVVFLAWCRGSFGLAVRRQVRRGGGCPRQVQCGRPHRSRACSTSCALRRVLASVRGQRIGCQRHAQSKSVPECLSPQRARTRHVGSANEWAHVHHRGPRPGEGTLVGRCRVGGWRADGRVRWHSRRFRSGPQSGSLGCVSSPRSPNPACRFPAPGSPAGSCTSHTGDEGRDSKDGVAAPVSAAEAARIPPFLPRRARRPSSLSTP